MNCQWWEASKIARDRKVQQATTLDPPACKADQLLEFMVSMTQPVAAEYS